MTKIAQVLAATDFSADGDRAVDVAADLARQLGATLTIVHVSEVPAFVPGSGLAASEAHADRDAMDRVLERLEQRGVAARGMLAAGVAAEEICRLAETENADLLVVGSRGSSVLAQVLLGSVAERVLHAAPCPVVTVRRREPPVHPPIAHRLG